MGAVTVGVDVPVLYRVPPDVELTVPAVRVEKTGELTNVLVPENLLLSPNKVEDAAVTVPDDPNAMLVLLTVIDEFWSAVLGRLRLELAATKGTPVLLVTTKPLVPRPQFVVVLNAVEITLPVTTMGYVPV